jgi:ABC-type multidrug transport system fused ATPase/permease subunit
LENNEKIPESPNPEKANITKGTIEFKNVSFTYDQKMKTEDQTNVIKDISF